MKRKGFTLIELVVVIALIAILAVTLAPRLRDQIAKANDSKAIAVLGALRTNSEVFFAEREDTVTNATSTDGIALAQLVGDLDSSSQRLFNDGNDVTIAYGTDGVATTDLTTAGQDTVPVGGTRPSANDDVDYGGTIGFDFGTDGIEVNFGTVTGTGTGTATHDTKRNLWASY